MPVYEYRCERGHTFEVVQRISEDPLRSCASCDATVKRVFHPVAVHFKGSGFYTTDYGKKKTGAASESASTDGGASKDDAKGAASSTTAKSGADSSRSESSGSDSSGKASSASTDTAGS